MVKSFQMRTEIAVDGIAGAKTEAQLLSELGNMRPTDGR
jgi:peptidoglycan hydrolase-like protein with peptidoglycan-binding domain